MADLTARAVNHGESGLMGLRIQMSKDLAPPCNISTDVLCDGRGYNNYDVEVIDRMGADSFTTDHGVMISKTKTIDNRKRKEVPQACRRGCPPWPRSSPC